MNVWDQTANGGAGDSVATGSGVWSGYDPFVEDGDVVADMQIFVRYAVSDNMFVQLVTPMSTEDQYNGNDYMRIGGGYSFNVWGDVNAEFTYSMKVNGGTDGDRGGKMGIGVSMKF